MPNFKYQKAPTDLTLFGGRDTGGMGGGGGYLVSDLLIQRGCLLRKIQLLKKAKVAYGLQIKLSKQVQKTFQLCKT